jgi:hypothetical protein
MKFKTVKKKDLVFSDHSELSLSEDRTFSGIAYSGKVIKNHPFWGDLAFDVSTMSSKPRIPILFNHDMEKIVGSGTLEFSDAVKVSGSISPTTKYGQEAYALIKEEGFPMQESVYIEPESIFNLPKGDKMTVNGQQLVGPATIFRGGKIKEVSLTPLGADSETSTTMFNDQEQELQILEETIMTEEMKKFSKLFAISPEEAFKFACSCQEKTTETASSDEVATLKAKVQELMAENEKLKANQKEKASLERKEKLLKVFSDLTITLNPDIEESYLEMSDEKFNKVISSLEADAVKFAEAKKEEMKKLTTYVEPPVKMDVKADEDKVFALAREIRKSDPSMAVATSLEAAREKLKSASAA